MEQFQNGKDKLSMHQKKVANYLTALKKEQHKKYIEFTLKEKKEQQ